MSPDPSPRMRCCLRQEQMPTPIWPSYFFSQWLRCSMSSDSHSAGMACSTGITCMPMPPPPGGTRWVMPARGRKVIRSKKSATCGVTGEISGRMTMISALPGTNMSSTQRFSWLGFLPSRFSKCHSTRLAWHSASSTVSRCSSSQPQSFLSWAKVLGLRLPIFSARSRQWSATSLP